MNPLGSRGTNQTIPNRVTSRSPEKPCCCLPIPEAGSGGEQASLAPAGESPAFCPLLIPKAGISILSSSQDHLFKSQILRLLVAIRAPRA